MNVLLGNHQKSGYTHEEIESSFYSLANFHFENNLVTSLSMAFESSLLML